ncbi:MAG: ABC transporter ATP-binding protein [Spirochaetaceae bacterium]|jgi:ABC-type Fe3+/spermidine/putrescine transport system ATPase subunit|nr:ABC transporter ATP-binding protein [Spirochaetaceae bacterium]
MALEIRGLEKTYEGFSLSLDLRVEAGETLALAGPSGCGKTTVLNLIAGLLRADQGSIFLEGKSISGLPSWKRNISVVFQDLALFPHLSVGNNVAYSLFIHRVPGQERRRIVRQSLKLVRLEGFERRRIDTLSGGERQRVAIARALAASPGLLLLDEPFSSLDAPLRRELRREFREIRSRSPIPCIFVTHDREEAAVLGDRIALMSAGRIVETGSGRDLFLTPKTEFCARFFGAGTVLPCTIEGQTSRGLRVSSALGPLTVTLRQNPGPEPEYNIAAPRIFVPRDAVSLGGGSVPDEDSGTGGMDTGERRKTGPVACKALFRGALFEGDTLTLEVELPGSGGGVPFSLKTGLRTELPSPAEPVVLHINEGLLCFVR